MSVTVGDLLERLHAIATVVSAEPSTGTPDVERHEVGLRGLARHVERALALLRFEEASVGQRTRLVAVGVLRAIGVAGGGVRPEGVRVGHLEDAALVVGAIADVLAGQRAPFRVERQPAWLPASEARSRRWSETPFEPVFAARSVGVASATGVQSSLLAAVHVLTQWSLRSVGDSSASPLRDLLRELAAVSEPHLWLAPVRRGTLDSIASTLAGHATWVGDALSRTLAEVALGSGRIWVANDQRHPTPGPDAPQLDVEGPGPAPGNPRWLIPLHPAAHAEQAVQAATDAARHARRAAQHLESLYPAGNVPETVPRLTIAGRRAHAQAATPHASPDRPRGPARSR